MEIPLPLEIDSLEGFSVCFFKDKNYAKKSPPHFYITIPTNQNSCLIICLISSKLEKRVAYYKKSNAKCLASLVKLQKTDLGFLKTESIIDCNNAEHIHRNELKNRVVPNTYRLISRDIPNGLKYKIIEAIRLSPKIKPYIKESIHFEEER